MDLWNPPMIRDLLIDAGRIALKHFTAPSIEHKADRSLVTAADRAVESFLFEQLHAKGLEAMHLGEESAESTDQSSIDRIVRSTSWIVDPIDGTAPYANGLPTWGISLGLVEEGRFAHGALFLPRTGEIFLTDGDAVLYQQGSRDPDSWRFTDLEPLVDSQRPYRSFGMVSVPIGAARTGRFDGANPVQSVGSAVYSVAKLVVGAYLSYIARVKVWDIAGSVPILRRLGFCIQFADGRELSDRIVDRDWILDASNPRVWKCKGPLFVAEAQETVDYVRTHFHNDSG